MRETSHNNENCSEDEQYMLSKYRVLDEYGRRMVDIVLELEWERCTQGEE